MSDSRSSSRELRRWGAVEVDGVGSVEVDGVGVGSLQVDGL